MDTIIVRNGDNLTLIPEFALVHAGIINDANGKNNGHTNFESATGSVFLNTPSIEEVIEMVKNIKNNGEKLGNLYQLDLKKEIGFDALTSAKNAVGFLMKEASDKNDRKKTRVVLTPAVKFSNEEEMQKAKTTNVSIIAPPTTNADFLPADLKSNPEVLEALKNGKLSTMISMFPGKTILEVNGEKVAVERAENIHKQNLAFFSSSKNENFIDTSLSPEQILEFVNNFNDTNISFSQKNEVRNVVLVSVSMELMNNELVSQIKAPDLQIPDVNVQNSMSL